MIRDRNSKKIQILLTEYNAAQSSAEHHDRLVWTVSSILWAGSLALMGIILKNLIEEKYDLASYFLMYPWLIFLIDILVFSDGFSQYQK
jgi:hypothetical protein